MWEYGTRVEWVKIYQYVSRKAENNIRSQHSRYFSLENFKRICSYDEIQHVSRFPSNMEEVFLLFKFLGQLIKK